MNDRASVAHELLAVVERDRDERVEELLARANTDRRQLLSAARAAARRNAGDAVREQRARSRRRLDAARAELSLRQRELAQQVDSELLARGMRRLQQELTSRWNDADRRAGWWLSALAAAKQALPAAQWTIEVGPMPESERQELAQCAGRSATVHPAPDIEAGVRIAGDGAMLDATLSGLLAAKESINGRLLLELDAALEEGDE